MVADNLSHFLAYNCLSPVCHLFPLVSLGPNLLFLSIVETLVIELGICPNLAVYYLNYLCKDCVFKQGHTPMYQGLGLEHISLGQGGGVKFNPVQYRIPQMLYTFILAYCHL